MKKRFKMKRLTLLLAFTLFYHPGMGEAQTSMSLIIRKFDNLQDVEIKYDYPDFHNPIIRINKPNSNKQKIQEFQASEVARFCFLNKDFIPDDHGLTMMRGNVYSKKIIESIVHGRYIVSIAMLHQDNAFIYGNFKNDLLLWKDVTSGYRLIAIYPEVIGGCLFCGAQFTEYLKDTLIIEFNGGSIGEKWGGREIFSIKNDSLQFYRSERYRLFSPTEGAGNPVANAYSRMVKKFFYDRQGRPVNSKIIFDARYENQSPVKLFCRSDSLKLFKASPNFQSAPLQYVKTVFIDNQPVRVGPIQGNFIPVFLEGKWYLTERT